MKQRSIPLLCVAGLVSFAAACGGGDGSSSGTPGGGPGGNGTFDPNDPRGVDLSGRYELSSQYDLTSAGVLPDMANQTLKALSDLKTNPSKTIVELLQAANVPIVATLLELIPSDLEAPFENWFNEYVFASIYQDAPVTKQITDLIGDIGMLATHFEVVSELELSKENEVGAGTAKHSLSGVAFTIQGQRTLVQLPILGPLTTADHVNASAVHIVERSPDVENGRLAVGDHAFGVPLGDFVSQGIIDKIVEARTGEKPPARRARKDPRLQQHRRERCEPVPRSGVHRARDRDRRLLRRGAR